jgi:predicted transcriptional regulator
VVNTGDVASEFLEVASEQRSSILLNLTKEKSNLSKMAKLVDASAAEVHRNFNRLQKSGLIKKGVDGNYDLTQYGRILCAQIPALEFMSKNLKYFENHNFLDLPFKYIQRIGALADSELITGYVKVTEKCEEIYNNANEYICNILVEIPYNDRLLQILESKLQHKAHIASIFSENAIISKDRKELLTKFNFTKFINDGTLERRM